MWTGIREQISPAILAVAMLLIVFFLTVYAECGTAASTGECGVGDLSSGVFAGLTTGDG